MRARGALSLDFDCVALGFRTMTVGKTARPDIVFSHTAVRGARW